ASKYYEEKMINTHYQPCRLKDIENYRMVLVEGTIFKVGEDRKTKKGKIIRTIEYNDGSDSIQSTLFESAKMPLEEMNQYKPGVKIRVYGQTIHDQYNHDELAIRIDKIALATPDPIREDTYPRKRVELHLHTNMSPFDGVTTIDKYCKTASKWGHKAIALTDHGGCQAFPDAQSAGEKNNIKVLYGTEFYVVNDKREDAHFIYNPSDRKLATSNFIIFDTETTGLSCRYDRLIEFGAVKVSPSGQVLDEIDFFINPDTKLSEFSIKVSHITQDMVDHGHPIKKALAMILEFFGDDILVAHNAAFDYDFLNEALKNNGLAPIQNPVIDTMQLSRYLYPEMRSHREEALASKLGVPFDKEGAHRANYDAEHLGKIFEVMLANLLEKNPDLTHQDLGALTITDQMLLTMHPYHVTAYARNSQGLKDLYRIISESNTKHIGAQGNPLVPLSYLEQYRENLLLGSACFNGDVFETAITKGEEKLKKKISFYDFIEVQPPENYIYLIHT
ncbi:MAG: exonuclease domain-containing protein, partial [Candidatus Enterosoma sp.]